MQEHTFCDTFLTVFIPPLGYYCKKKELDSNALIATLLMLFTFNVFAPIFVFYSYGMDPCISVLCAFFPPLGVLFGVGGCGKTMICILLTCCFVLPGVLYAYHVNMEEVEQGKQI